VNLNIDERGWFKAHVADQNGRTIFSDDRRKTFYALVHAASKESSEDLHAILHHFGDRMTVLHRLACLRVLVWRDHGIKRPSGLPYPQRKRAVRNTLGI
jgi:hypothetical protein